ncbi:MAG: hypothetical protein R3B07_07520 [Polyangiaceae bacterium]
MTLRAIAALGVLFVVSACGGSEFVADSGDGGTTGGSGGTGNGGTAGGANGGSAGNAGSAGSASGGSASGGASGSAGTGGSGGSVNCATLNCDDDNECTTDVCDPDQGCIHEPRSDQPCDDGIFCNGEDRCVGTKCEEHLGDPCGGVSVCDEGQDTCVGCIQTSDCPGQTVGAYSNCMFDSECAATGTKTRSITTYSCSGGTCKPSTTMDPASCNRSIDGQACTTDGNPCTGDVCRGGNCVHDTLLDGSTCTGENGTATGPNFLCCGGHCKATNSDSSNCGGCYVKCGGVATLCSDGYCRTCGTSQTDCDAVSPGMVCNGNAQPARCECDEDQDCPMSWQTCSTQHQCRGIAPDPGSGTGGG